MPKLEISFQYIVSNLILLFVQDGNGLTIEIMRKEKLTQRKISSQYEDFCFKQVILWDISLQYSE